MYLVPKFPEVRGLIQICAEDDSAEKHKTDKSKSGNLMKVDFVIFILGSFLRQWGMGISVRVAGGEWLVAGKGF
jgi:hypothetical protein